MRHGLLQIATVPVHDLYTLKFWSTFQTISISSYRPLTNLTSYTRKLKCILTFFESLIIHSVCSQICRSACFQKLFFRKYSILPIDYAERGANSVLWVTKIIASYVSILTNFYRKWTKTCREKIIIMWSWTCDRLQSKVLPKVP